MNRNGAGKLFHDVILLASLWASAVASQEKADSEKLGKVQFPVSCSAEAQTQSDRAIALLHSFWLDEAARRSRRLLRPTPAARWHTGVPR